MNTITKEIVHELRNRLRLRLRRLGRMNVKPEAINRNGDIISDWLNELLADAASGHSDEELRSAA